MSDEILAELRAIRKEQERQSVAILAAVLHAALSGKENSTTIVNLAQDSIRALREPNFPV